MSRLSRSAVAALVCALIVAALQSTPSANHMWNTYHWERTANPFLVQLGDNLSTSWDPYLAVASNDWSQNLFGNPVRTTVVQGGTNPRPCRPTSGRDEVCNASYGNTGWLGIAQIWVTGGTHIYQGTTKLNDSYFSTPQYNTPAWRQFVVCQEVGHTFGLTHQDETFGNTNLGSCMDYTDDPDGTLHGQLDNQHPNQHDYEELALIYSHLDTSSTLKGAAAAAGANLDSPREWGQLMRSSHSGRTQVFERDFGNGERVITFVIWA
jgi:hypothetical protein